MALATPLPPIAQNSNHGTISVWKHATNVAAISAWIRVTPCSFLNDHGFTSPICSACHAYCYLLYVVNHFICDGLGDLSSWFVAWVRAYAAEATPPQPTT